MFETISAFWAEYGTLLLEGTRDTLIMTGVATIFAYVLGLPLGVLLSISQPHGIWPHKWCNRILGWVINVGRSLPFIILMVAIMPFTKAVVGTKMGILGAIVPLVVSAAPFIARMVETSLAEVDAGVVEAAQSMGASRLQIIWKVYLPEARPPSPSSPCWATPPLPALWAPAAWVTWPCATGISGTSSPSCGSQWSLSSSWSRSSNPCSVGCPPKRTSV